MRLPPSCAKPSRCVLVRSLFHLGMATEFGLIWGHVTLRTSFGVTYVDQEQYPEVQLDGRETLVLPGVHEVMIAEGDFEIQIKDCHRALLRSYKVQHRLSSGETSLISAEGDMRVRLLPLPPSSWQIEQIVLHLPLFLQVRAVSELNNSRVRLQKVAPFLYYRKKPVPGQIYDLDDQTGMKLTWPAEQVELAIVERNLHRQRGRVGQAEDHSPEGRRRGSRKTFTPGTHPSWVQCAHRPA